MLKNRSIFFKLVLFLWGTCLIVLVSIFLFKYHFSRKLILKNVRENAESICLYSINKIETTLDAVATMAENMAALIQEERMSEEEIHQLIKSSLRANPEVYGSTVAF